VAFQIWKTVQVLQQGLPAGKPLPAPTNTTKHVQSFLGLNLRLVQKNTEPTQTQKVEQTVSGAVCFTKRNLLEPPVSRFKTSPSLACCKVHPDRPHLGDGDGKPTSALASVSIKPGAFSSTESLQFETHFPFIFVL